MSANMKLSIIVPVYNVERYLGRCIESLLETEGIGNIEIILVDDGSTDGSGRIADEYAAEHPFIRVIRKTNEGPSAARNAGLKEACGEYVFFCDSDDEVYPDRLAAVIRQSESIDADIILWDAEVFDDISGAADHKESVYYVHRGLNENNGIITGKQVIGKQIDACEYFPATVWFGLHRRRFLLDADLLFEEGILHEDELWAIKAILLAQRVKYIPKVVYRYRIHTGSVTAPDDKDWTKHIESLLFVYPELFRFSDDHLAGDPLKKDFDANVSRRYLHMIGKYDFCRYGYGDRIDKKKLWKTTRHFSDRCRVLFLAVYGCFCKAFLRGNNANTDQN